jgi:hypothetical protein
MDSTVEALEMDSMLSRALEIFDKTRFAFAPIIANRDNERKGEIDSSPMEKVIAEKDRKYYDDT